MLPHVALRLRIVIRLAERLVLPFVGGSDVVPMAAFIIDTPIIEVGLVVGSQSAESAQDKAGIEQTIEETTQEAIINLA